MGALVVTEWGTCDASGDGSLDLESSRQWIAFLDEHKISHANWALSDKPEAASAFRPGASGTGGWTDEDLTPSGYWVRNMIMGDSGGGGCCRFGADCGDCGDDGTGWCHQSASNCATCTGSFDSSAATPNCNGSPTPGVSPTPSGGGWVQGTYTTGYWDCCKPSCSWPGKGNVNQPFASCDTGTGEVLTNFNAPSACGGGHSAASCADNKPFSVAPRLSYAFT